jgi:general secretion pathway protein D
VAEGRKEYDKALELYEQALSEDPVDAAYQMAVNRVRFQAGQTHVTRGRRLREAGNLEGAVVEFQKAFAIDPASTIAEQELRQTNQMLEAEKRRKRQPGAAEPKPEERGISPTQMARREAEQRAAAMKGVPYSEAAQGRDHQSPDRESEPEGAVRNRRQAGRDQCPVRCRLQDQGKRYSLDLARTTLTEALDYTALLSKSFWKPLSDNTIFITVDNVTKRRDYEEHVSRVFYLQNITSPQELQEVMTAVRQVTDVRKVFPVNSQSALIIRGTADQMALAEKVILDLDKPKPEVVVDVMVFETARSVTRELGLLALTTGGINVPVNFTPQGGATGTGGATSPSIA